MPGLLLQLFRIVFLILVWLFIWLTIKVINEDLNFSQTTVSTSKIASRRDSKRNKVSKKTPRYLQIVKGGKLTGTHITLGDQPILIGRADDCTLVLTDDYISNHHARLIPKSSNWYLEDLGATNGTFLDNTRVSTPVKVLPRAKIQLGQTILELKS